MNGTAYLSCFCRFLGVWTLSDTPWFSPLNLSTDYCLFPKWHLGGQEFEPLGSTIPLANKTRMSIGAKLAGLGGLAGQIAGRSRRLGRVLHRPTGFYLFPRCLLVHRFWGLIAYDPYLSFDGLITRGITCFSEGSLLTLLYGRFCKCPDEFFHG
jgi:hypothetical protein